MKVVNKADEDNQIILERMFWIVNIAAAVRRFFGTDSIIKVRMINKKYGIDLLRIL